MLASFYVGSFSYTSLAGFIFMWGVSLTHPMLASFLSGQFPLHIPSCVHFYLASVCYTSHAGFTFLRGVSLTHPMLHPTSPPHPTPFFLFFFFKFSGVSLTHPVPSSFSDTSHAAFILTQGVSLTHPKLPSVLCGEFLLHIPCWLPFMRVETTRADFFCYGGRFSYTSRAGFIFIYFYMRNFFPLQSTVKTIP